MPLPLEGALGDLLGQVFVRDRLELAGKVTSSSGEADAQPRVASRVLKPGYERPTATFANRQAEPRLGRQLVFAGIHRTARPGQRPGFLRR